MARTRGSQTLSRPLRRPVLARHLGDVALVLAAAAAPPLLVAVAAREWALGATLLATGLAASALGWALRRLPQQGELAPLEAIVLTVLSFVGAALGMTPAFVVAGVAPLDALFEAVSGVTTTGLSTLGSVEELPESLLFLRAWLQWVGGLGIAVLCVALLVRPGMAARRLGLGEREEHVLSSARGHVRAVLRVYVTLTALGVLLLVVTGVAPWTAVLHALAALSTGGFAPRDAGLGALSGPQAALVLALGLVGAVSLPLWGRARRQGPRVLARDLELRTLLGLVAACALLLVCLGRAPGSALALATSAQSTSGFASGALRDAAPAEVVVLCGAMLSGGAVGSTAGGLKLLRLAVVAAALRWALRRPRLPAHAVDGPTLGGERLRDEEVRDALTLVAAFAGALAVSWLAFLASGHEPLAALFEVSSALGTVGLSSGLTGPDLAPGLKLVLCGDMILGRLEVVAVLVVLAPGSWWRRGLNKER